MHTRFGRFWRCEVLALIAAAAGVAAFYAQDPKPAMILLTGPPFILAAWMGGPAALPITGAIYYSAIFAPFWLFLGGESPEDAGEAKAPKKWKPAMAIGLPIHLVLAFVFLQLIRH